MALQALERRFVTALLETGDTGLASQAAGEGIHHSELLARISVTKALRDGLASRLLRAAPMALSVLESLAKDETIPPAVRRLAASDILDRVGLVSQAALALSKPIESLSDMPARDLRALVSRLESELFARATPVRELELTALPAPSVLD